ncbi:MAG: diguanylate cyclase [Gammaproteobacteria bacterium]|nr:diguanylate cyclase [Gammaproteobacteria bacterium]
MKVLLIEPTKLYQQIIYEMLGNSGIDVKAVSIGSEGISLLKENDYDFILVSKNLPDMNGIEFGNIVQNINSFSRNNTLVMLTADDVDISKNDAKMAGFSDVLPKDNYDALYSGLLKLAGQAKQNKASKVLYIEDSISMAQVTIAILENMLIEVDHFVNGELAMQSFHDQNYDLVISDVFIEGKLSGADIVEIIRKSGASKSRVPVLAVSGQNDVKMRIEVLSKGANDFITKPIQEDEFCARVNNLLSLKKLFDTVDEQQKKLFDMAMTDQLTKLYNRHSLTEMAPKYISESKRHNHDLGLLIIDLDHFKQINDNHGHATGDIVLSQVGKLLNQVCRKEDFAARFGGEEFVMLLSHCDAKSAFDKAESIRQKLENLSPAGLKVTASIGVASTSQVRDVDFDGLFEIADKAVYFAKENGRNQIQCAPDSKAA